MALSYRKTIRTGKNSHLNVSKSGVSQTMKFGPVTVNSRGHVRVRLGKGLSWRIF